MHSGGSWLLTIASLELMRQTFSTRNSRNALMHCGVGLTVGIVCSSYICPKLQYYVSGTLLPQIPEVWRPPSKAFVSIYHPLLDHAPLATLGSTNSSFACVMLKHVTLLMRSDTTSVSVHICGHSRLDSSEANGPTHVPAT